MANTHIQTYEKTHIHARTHAQTHRHSQHKTFTYLSNEPTKLFKLQHSVSVVVHLKRFLTGQNSVHPAENFTQSPLSLKRVHQHIGHTDGACACVYATTCEITRQFSRIFVIATFSHRHDTRNPILGATCTHSRPQIYLFIFREKHINTALLHLQKLRMAQRDHRICKMRGRTIRQGQTDGKK
jgi:hypothetical protein